MEHTWLSLTSSHLHQHFEGGGSGGCSSAPRSHLLCTLPHSLPTAAQCALPHPPSPCSPCNLAPGPLSHPAFVPQGPPTPLHHSHPALFTHPPTLLRLPGPTLQSPPTPLHHPTRPYIPTHPPSLPPLTHALQGPPKEDLEALQSHQRIPGAVYGKGGGGA